MLRLGIILKRHPLRAFAFLIVGLLCWAILFRAPKWRGSGRRARYANRYNGPKPNFHRRSGGRIRPGV